MLEGYITVLFETFILKVFFDTFLKQPNLPDKRTYSLFFLISIINFALSTLLSEYFFIKEIGVILATFFILLLYKRGNWKKILTLTVIFYGILIITDYITLFIEYTVYGEAEIALEETGILIILLDKIVLLLLVLILKAIFDRSEVAVLEDKDWIKMSVFPLFSIGMIVAMLSQEKYGMTERLGELFLIIAFGLVAINVVMFVILRDILARETFIRDAQIYTIETQNKLNHYKTLSKSIEKQRSISHEYKNQLNVIQGLCNRNNIDELKIYLEEINGKVREDLDRIDTHHSIVNTVINEKYSEALSLGIAFVCKIGDMSTLTMEDKDIVTLLSNILNNAIEACKKVETKKIIKLKFVCEEKAVILSCKNSYDGNIRKRDGELVTTKSNRSKEHGYGLKNIIQIVEKYDGDYVIQPGEKDFLIAISFRQR